MKNNLRKKDIDKEPIFNKLSKYSYMSNEDFLDLKNQMEEIMSCSNCDTTPLASGYLKQ